MVAESSFGYEEGHAVADDLASDPLMRRDPYVTREMAPSRRDPQVRRAPNASGLYEVLDLILDKGIVIDAFVRVSLVGIELVTIDLRVVIASVDTYLRYAEGAERLQIYKRSDSKKLPDMVGSAKKGSALKKGAEKVGEMITGGNGKHGKSGDDEGEEGDEGGFTGTIKRGVRKFVHKITGSEDDEGGDEGESRHGDRESRHAKKHHGAGR